MSGALLLAPLRVEALALRSARGGARVVRTGMGRDRAEAAAERAARLPADVVAVVGVAGALDQTLRPGDLVVADEVRAGDVRVRCPAAGVLADVLRRRGLPVRVGPVVSSSRLVRGAARTELGAEGALAVDMESAWLTSAAAGRPFAVVRAMVDVPGRELLGPRTPLAGIRALGAVRRAAPAFDEWARAVRAPPAATTSVSRQRDGTQTPHPGASLCACPSR